MRFHLIWYALAIDTKIKDLRLPWAAETHSCKQKKFAETTRKIWNTIDRRLTETISGKCRPMILVYRNIRYVWIFARVPRGGGVKRQWSKAVIFIVTTAICSETFDRISTVKNVNLFNMRCTIVQSAVLREHVVRLSVRMSVSLWRWWIRTT